MKKSLAKILVFGFISVTFLEVRASATANQSREKKGLLSKKVKFNEHFKKWKLELSGERISDLTNLSNVEDIKKVERLYLHNNCISTIKESDLKKCENLKKLHLRNNKIKAIMVGMFSCLKKLEYLDVSRNPIESIEPGALACLAATLKEILIDKRLLDDQNIFDQIKKELPSAKIAKIWPEPSLSCLREKKSEKRPMYPKKDVIFKETGSSSSLLDNNNILKIKEGNFEKCKNLKHLYSGSNDKKGIHLNLCKKEGEERTTPFKEAGSSLKYKKQVVIQDQGSDSDLPPLLDDYDID